jgi:hypothetical protein
MSLWHSDACVFDSFACRSRNPRKASCACAAGEAAIANEDERAAEIRRWRAWMAENRSDGLDPLHGWLKALAHIGPKVVEPRDARREAREVLGREATAEELEPFLEDVALENEFQSKYGRGPTWRGAVWSGALPAAVASAGRRGRRGSTS